jgi:hypothetical protein
MRVDRNSTTEKSEDSGGHLPHKKRMVQPNPLNVRYEALRLPLPSMQAMACTLLRMKTARRGICVGIRWDVRVSTKHAPAPRQYHDMRRGAPAG